MKNGVCSLVLLLMLGVVGSVHAVDEDKAPLKGFERIAVLESIDFPARKAIIGGKTYPLAPDVQWYGLEPNVSPEAQRHRIYGKSVGYNLVWNESGPVVTTIWVLSQ